MQIVYKTVQSFQKLAQDIWKESTITVATVIHFVDDVALADLKTL